MSPTALVRSAALSLSPLAALMSRLQRHRAAIEAAHDRQARFATLTEQDHRDLGVPYEVFMGERASDPALPFFLQRRIDG